MNTLKLFALPSHQTEDRTSGVDFVRVIQPMKHLNGYVHGNYKFKVDVFDIFNKKDWMAVAEDYDGVFLNYTVLDWAYAAMGCFVHGKKKKIIMDMDDALWHVNNDNIAFEALKEHNAGYVITQILKDVDGIVTTNPYLRNLIAHKTQTPHEFIKVIPNSVDLKYYNHVSPAKNNHQINLFHFGSTSHFDDLSRPDFVDGLDMIFKDYPNVYFRAIGANIGKLKLKWGERYTYGWGHSDIYKWIGEKFPVYMDEADIMVVPLMDNRYNICKSDIKFLETATAKKPGVYSRIRPYTEAVEHGVTGYLADAPEEWYDSLKELIESAEKRKEIGENAYNYVTKERTIDKYIPDYAEFLIKILTKQCFT